MDEIHAGSCLCGTVRFEVSGEFAAFFLCHCGRCRKDTGSSHAANLFSPNGRLNWISGSDRVRTYRLPETRHERSFCTECGSALPSAQADGFIVVPAGSLDGPVPVRPTAHICFASRADWDPLLEDIPTLDGLPGQ
ncbi:GFA family protein [Rhizobium grahamii]|uniref:GFA family protein n=1 Tax=Rhizobium grahamii TaxID=1120045 RepID=A0A5Q0C4V2_9HYPH|nr:MULTISPECIES: GFA family protein [Rhizobium]QFY60275.1 GFA family protein [Rhizobium grahamii]QRM50601.1 GFA family protein [Rhizobium sp. BG6]